MTKVLMEPVGWVYLVLVLDWYTKKIVGHYAGLQAFTSYNNPKENPDTERSYGC